MAEIPYLLDLLYTTYYFAQQSPTVLDYAARLHGAKGCDLSQPFTYCDLGCGNGLTDAFPDFRSKLLPVLEKLKVVECLI